MFKFKTQKYAEQKSRKIVKKKKKNRQKLQSKFFAATKKKLRKKKIGKKNFEKKKSSKKIFFFRFSKIFFRRNLTYDEYITHANFYDHRSSGSGDIRADTQTQVEDLLYRF